MYVHSIAHDCIVYVPRCIAHKIHVLNLPAHTTHLLQVADISVFGPFKRELPAALNFWRTTHDYKILPQHMAAATAQAWVKATSRKNCIMGFEKAGICPFDRTKITPQIYKEGALFRGLPDDSLKYTPPPVPLYPPRVLDSSSSSAPPVSSTSPVLHTVSSVLAPPKPAPIPPRKPRAPNTVSTTYAVMLTEPEIVNELKRKQDKKDQAEAQKAEKKRKREEKKQEKAANPPPVTRKRQPKSVRLPNRLSNKENIPPPSQNMDYDPYA